MKPDTQRIELEYLDTRARNPNRMSPIAFDMLVEAIRRHGFLQPILVRDLGERFEIVDGAHRCRAAREVGITSVPCVVLEEGDDAEAIAAALQIGMNRLRGDLDLTETAEVLAGLAASGWGAEELAVTGFDASEIDELIASVKTEDTKSLLAGSETGIPDEDEAPDEKPAIFTIEIELSSRTDLVRAKKALRSAGSGDMGRGLLALLGDPS